MHAFRFAAALLLSLLTAVPALAQTPPTRVRGTIVSLDGQMLTVKGRRGDEMKIKLADNYSVAAVVPITLADIKQGSFIGSAAIKQADGTLKAQEVLVFPEAMRGAGEGHYPWDLTPNSTMTNATVEAVVDGTSGREMSLTYKGGKQKIAVPPNTPVVTFEPGDKSMLKAGAKVFIGAQKAADGSLSAGRVAVGKDGFTPPM
ncbi:MAG TPA: hypothetical protein VGN52_07785 [Burkholderiales bacterium]